MKDKRFTKFMVGAGLALLAWYLSHRKQFQQAQQQSDLPALEPSGYNLDPIALTYAADPGKWGPESINVNIANQGLNYLNTNYIPLFGFVGMAQGVYFQ